MLFDFISLRFLYRIGCLMVISAGLAAADTLPAGPGLLLEDRDGRVYVAVLGSEGIVVRNASDDADTWEVVAEGRVRGSADCPRRGCVDGPRRRGSALPSSGGRAGFSDAFLSCSKGRRDRCWRRGGAMFGAPGAVPCVGATPCSRLRRFPRLGGRSRRCATIPSAMCGLLLTMASGGMSPF